MKPAVLAIGAHPDDIEIGCGGTLCLLKDRGYDLIFAIITSGEEGGIQFSKDELARTRENEASHAAKILGASEVIFFREPDGLTGYSKESKIRLMSLVRKTKPEIVFTHVQSDPLPDHQIVHQLVHSAILAAGGPWYQEAGSTAHRVKDVYGYEVWNPISHPQITFDISSVIERKLAALRCHESQIQAVDYIGATRGLAKYRAVTGMSGQYAEAFEVLKTRLDL